MELKLSGSELFGSRKLLPNLFLNSIHLVSDKVSPQACACNGNFMHASLLSTAHNAASSVVEEKLTVDVYSLQTNGTNGAAPALAGLRKIPTGFIHKSEEIFNGAVREVKEETGIDTEFVDVVAFRHAHNVAFQKSDLFFVCMMRALSNDIVIDNLEVQSAKWMPLVDFVKQPLSLGDRMFKKIIDICIARMGER